MMSKSDKKGFLKLQILQGSIAKRIGTLAIVIFIVGGLAYTLLPIFLGSSITNTTELAMILLFSAIMSVCICVSSIVIVSNALKKDRLWQEKEKQNQRLESKCRECMYELLDVQRHLYGKDVEAALHELSIEDIQKISLMAEALIADDATISDDEIEKIRMFFNVLLSAKRAGKYASYITIDDMKVIESNVDEKASIIVVSSSVSCDEELQPIIKGNLANGVHYKYYFPRNSGTFPGYEETFCALLDQFNKNLVEWQKDSCIGYDTIKKQVTCAWFPEEYMQMSFTAYNFQRVGIEGKSPEIIVKFPALDTNVSDEYPLFYYVNKENGINRKMCESLNYIAHAAKPLSVFKLETGEAQFEYQSSQQKTHT